MQPEVLDALAGEVASAIKGALAPVVADVKALQASIAVWEARWSDSGALRERVAVLEAKSAAPAPVVQEARPAAADEALVDLRARVALLEVKGQGDDLAGVRERLAVLETRAPVPGPAGADGLNGKDGADGLGFEDLAVEFDGDRTIAVTFARGGETKAFPIVLPFLKYHGVYQDGGAYVEGDVVTWAGSVWVAKAATTTKPGDGSKVWTLAVKKGRDGKDWREPTAAPLPVVSVGAPRLSDIEAKDAEAERNRSERAEVERRKSDLDSRRVVVDPDIEAVRRSETVKRAAPWEGQGRRD